MRKKSTIKDIAKKVGVSPTAVSAVLNNRSRPRTSQETRKKILRVAKEMKYQPNLLARGLVNKKSHLIGLVVTTMLNPIYPELAQGIEDEALRLGYNILLCSTNNDQKIEASCIKNLLGKGVEGLIISSVSYDGSSILELIEDQFPFVLLTRTVDEDVFGRQINHVVLDNFRGGYLAMEHFYRLGYDRIGIIAGDLETSTGKFRTEGFNKALADFGYEYDPGLFFECKYQPELAYQATQKLLSIDSPPRAIFAQSDHMALSVREAVLEAGLKIPEDIALIGFDNIAMASLKGIELTTINLKKYEMGAVAVKILVDKLNNNSLQMSSQITLEPELIIRESCGFRLFGARRNGGQDNR
jgi:LacI family transcriptional regulator